MHWANLFVGLGGGTATLGGIGVVARHFLKNMIQDIVSAAVDAFKTDVSKALTEVNQNVQSVAMKLASETGGNSNGIRQKLNEVSGEVGDVRQDVAELKGAYEQYVRTHGAPVTVTVPVQAAPLPPASQ